MPPVSVCAGLLIAEWSGMEEDDGRAGVAREVRRDGSRWSACSYLRLLKPGGVEFLS